MQVTRATAAPRYDAPDHAGMEMIRLQGREASDTRSVWVGHSSIQPGGGTSLKASAQEKLYLCLEGEVTIGNGTEEVTLRPLDSVQIAPDEPRRIENRSDQMARLVLIMEHAVL